MNKEDIINQIVIDNNYQKYLEVGYQYGICFNRIECNYKIGIDPQRPPVDPNKTITPTFLRLSSDEFFEKQLRFQPDFKFDVIFIDGSHHADQVMKDICNASKCLSENGCILLHDIAPETEEMTRVPRETKIWTGDVYKAWMAFKEIYSHIYTIEYPVKYGLGAIYPKGQIIKEFNYMYITWKDYQNSKSIYTA